ncbi:MAG TPA: SPW repeat protein [Candidatus Eisenbacteria bacterium]|nr:SPW repeat protein [Candidatus Eisenbacteria bacterium]
MKAFHWFAVYLLVGLWLVVSPYALGFTDLTGAYWNNIVFGAFLALISVIGLYYARGESLTTAPSHKKAA